MAQARLLSIAAILAVLLPWLGAALAAHAESQAPAPTSAPAPASALAPTPAPAPAPASASALVTRAGEFAWAFPSGSVTDTTVAGESGLLVLAPGDSARALGFRRGDVVLAANGVRPAAWRAPADAHTGVTWTVWRRVPGDRPVVEPVVLGRRTLGEFTALAPAERTPMRLALMLANRLTLVRDGAGVLLLPSPAPGGEAAWLRFATPMPAVSESALVEVSTALLERVRIPPASGGEAAAARTELDLQHFVEAEEHARRALLEIVRDPSRRAPSTEFDQALQMYMDAQAGAARERAELLAPETKFAFVGEAQVNYIQAFPAQHTLHVVDNSYGWGWAAGLRLGWPWGSPRVLSDCSLLAEYGQLRNTFDGEGGAGGFKSTLQQITGEVLYRPRVASRLKPYLRGGVGAFPLQMLVQAPEGYRAAFERTNLGFVVGGGIDVFRVTAAHLRLGIGGTYRNLKYKILKENAPEVENTRNTDLTVITTVDNDPSLLMFDMDGWQVGVMVTYEP